MVGSRTQREGQYTEGHRSRDKTQWDTEGWSWTLGQKSGVGHRRSDVKPIPFCPFVSNPSLCSPLCPTPSLGVPLSNDPSLCPTSYVCLSVSDPYPCVITNPYLCVLPPTPCISPPPPTLYLIVSYHLSLSPTMSYCLTCVLLQDTGVSYFI